MENAPLTSTNAHGRHRSLRKRRGRAKVKLQPELTPMIDVTFLLLLFFLLTMRFQQAEGQLPADLPRPEAAAVAATVPLEPVRVTLDVDDAGALAIHISQVDVSVETWGQLYAALVQVRDRFDSDEIPIIVAPGPQASWEQALNAYNEARRARFRNIAFGESSP